MIAQAAISETVPLVVIGVVLLLALVGFPFILRPMALINRNHRLSHAQAGLMAVMVLGLLAAVAAISYIGRHHFSVGLRVVYFLVACAFGIFAVHKIVLESEDQ